ncbi:MAG TPA: DUF5667 domain-containing protein, partial [Candidatus Nanoarchaeia archaeon]|nr:DUF5667 domain-containing protein [Candidatus Nanoarchaeia archaeon]
MKRLYSLLVLFLMFGAVFVSGQENATNGTSGGTGTLACTDTDGGNDPYTLGSTTTNASTGYFFPESCRAVYGANIMQEFFCNASASIGASGISYYCDSCGSPTYCVPSTQIRNEVVYTDSDGGISPLIYGELTLTTSHYENSNGNLISTGTSVYNDQCSYFGNNGLLYDWYNYNAETGYGFTFGANFSLAQKVINCSLTYGPSYSCVSGACFSSVLNNITLSNATNVTLSNVTITNGTNITTTTNVTNGTTGNITGNVSAPGENVTEAPKENVTSPGGKGYGKGGKKKFLAYETKSLSMEAGVTPDSTLYFFDVALDRIALNLARNPQSRAERGLLIAQERLLEIEELIAEKKFDKIWRAQDEHKKALADVELAAEELEEDDASEELQGKVELELKVKEYQDRLENTEAELEEKLAEGELTLVDWQQVSAIVSEVRSQAYALQGKVQEEKEKTEVKVEQEGLDAEDIEKEIKDEVGFVPEETDVVKWGAAAETEEETEETKGEAKAEKKGDEGAGPREAPAVESSEGTTASDSGESASADAGASSSGSSSGGSSASSGSSSGGGKSAASSAGASAG